MKTCSKSWKENNQDSKFCNSCGNKFDNQILKSNSENNKTKKSKMKTILIIMGVIVWVFLLVGIISVSLFIKVLGNRIDGIKDKIDAYEKKEQIRDDIYDGIPEELLNRNLISKNLKYVNYKYGWKMEWADKTNKYYFYINSNNYDKYKSYWLEGIYKSQYRNKYNEGLATYSDYAFTDININDLSYESEVEYGNVHLTVNRPYYLIQIYDETNYYVYSASNCKKDSISKEYIFHQENGKWCVNLQICF